MKKLIILIYIINCLICSIKAQDPIFSQFFQNSLSLNPAAAGISDYTRFFLHYRNQWPAFDKTFITYEGSYDQYIKSINGGIGLNILRDNLAGSILTSTNVDLIYSYRTKITRNFLLQSGLQASLQFHNLNSTSLNTQTTQTVAISQLTTQPDFSIGFFGKTRYSWIGLSFHHLNSGYIQFTNSFVSTPLKISLYYSRNIKIYNKNMVKNNGFILTPAIMFQKQAQSIAFNYGTNFTFGDLNVGAWIRNNMPFQFSSIIFSIGYTFNNLKVGYSYDYEMLSVNNLMPVTGAHEFTCILIIPTDPKRKRYGPVKCPKEHD